ncbi:tetratricopeptide repeat protein [Chloroherpeton thalassium]|nr:tetratricopeptide repeat protein [Chloroherpeton thalassium]
MPEIVKELEQKLKLMNGTEHETIEKVDILNKLSWELQQKHATRALELSLEAEEISQVLGYQKGQAYALCNEGMSYKHLSEYDQALIKCEEALRLFEMLNDQSGKVSTLHSLANLYENMGENEKALRYYRMCLNECTEHQEPLIRISTHFHIGKILVRSNQIISGLAHLHDARNIAIEAMDKRNDLPN